MIKLPLLAPKVRNLRIWKKTPWIPVTDFSLSDPYTYRIDGDPTSLERPRFGNHHVYDSQKELKRLLRVQMESQHDNKPLLTGPLKLEAHFTFLPGARSNPKLSSQMDGSFHLYKPDLSNLIKFIEDIMIGIAYKDDCQISTIVAHKYYRPQPFTQFSLYQLQPSPKESHEDNQDI